MKYKYTIRFATEYHEPVARLSQIGRWGGPTMGFFLGKKVIGTASLYMQNKKKKWVHTDQMEIFDKFRNQGHGIHLYLAIIRIAKKLGAKRIYSSKCLNKFSSRMWQVKLDKLLPVIHSGPRCKCKCRNCRYKRDWHYIDLGELNENKIPR
jgi:GNAT superfamily N-acetyltransferase